MRQTISRSRMTAVALCATALAGGLLAGCKSQNAANGGSSGAPGPADTANANDIVVGEYGSITGSEASFGKSTDDGIQLATEALNSAGGIGGKHVRIALEDDGSEASKAATAVRRLIDEKHVVAILGEVASSASLAGGQVCQEKGIPMITPSSTKTEVTKLGDEIFRVCFIDPFQSAVVARYAHDALHAKRVAIYTNKGQAYSVGFSDNFAKAFTGMGGQIVATQSYSATDTNFSGALTAIKAANPDAILVPGYYQDAGSIAKQARDLGITVPLLGGDGWDSALLFQTGGDAVNGCFFSDHMSVDDPNPVVQGFVKSYEARFHKQPDALAALGYDAANVLFAAMKRTSSLDPKSIRDQIAQTKEFPGVTGKVTIDSERNASKPAVIIAVNNGKFKFASMIADPSKPLSQQPPRQ